MGETTQDWPTPSLASALAAVQAGLPAIHKGETAKVETKGGGSYSYTYADLASISAALLPLLARHGLSFIAKPTVTDTGAFVLAYSLLHVSGQREDGSYTLPSGGTPQQVGSAITYARRYTLCAVTGVAPEDDDGQAAEQGARESRQPPPQRNGGQPKPGPAKRIQDALSKAGLPLSAFTAYLGAEHGVERFGELSESMQESVADGITKGVLSDDVRKHAAAADDAEDRSRYGDGGAS